MIAGPRAAPGAFSHAGIARDFLTRFPEFAYRFIIRMIVP
jgi:hypothetical protein